TGQLSADHEIMKWSLVIIALCLTLRLTAHEYHFRLLPADYTGDIQDISLLYQSSDKLMWLGTDQGLYSFDGRKYKFFPRPDKARIRVTSIAEDSEGEIWAGYDDGQIIISNYQHTLRHLEEDSLKGIKISNIIFYPDHHVMLATYGKGLWEINHDHFEHLHS